MFNDLWKGVPEKTMHDIMQEYIHKFLVIIIEREGYAIFYRGEGGGEAERRREREFKEKGEST